MKGEESKGDAAKENGSMLRNKFANVYTRFGTEPKLEERGVVMDYDLADGSTFSIKIKRAGARNEEWKRLYNEIVKPRADDIIEGKVSEKENKILLAEVWAKSVVVGWANIKDSEGNEVPFSVENCYELFCFMPDLLNDVINDSHNRSNFQEEIKQATAKN